MDTSAASLAAIRPAGMRKRKKKRESMAAPFAVRPFVEMILASSPKRLGQDE